MKCYNCNATQAAPLLSCPDTGVCGTPFQAKNLPWKKAESAAVYADKIFSAHKADGSSLFYALNTADTPENFLSAYELTPCAGGCCCGAATLSEDAVFEIRKTYVQLDCFSVNEPEPSGASQVIAPAQVTVNGAAVNGITFENGRYTADLSNIIGDLINPVCAAQDLPSDAYLLLQDIGNLEFRARFGFEGVVRSCGALYRFKVYVATNEAILLPEAQTTSFAIAQANIPCIENGNSPVLSFRFGGEAQVINPQLSVTVADDADPCNGVIVNLTATLGITPAVYAEVVRRTLMMISGAELYDDCKCGLDGFNLFAAGACCDATPQPTNSTSGIVRCGCNRNN